MTPSKVSVSPVTVSRDHTERACNGGQTGPVQFQFQFVYSQPIRIEAVRGQTTPSALAMADGETEPVSPVKSPKPSARALQALTPTLLQSPRWLKAHAGSGSLPSLRLGAAHARSSL